MTRVANRDAKRRNGESHLGRVIDGAEALVAATADLGEDKLSDLRTSLEADLEAARAHFKKLEAGLTRRATDTDTYVHEKPWQSIGVAAGAGVLIGVLVGAVAFRH